MKLSRRQWIQAAGIASTLGCAGEQAVGEDDPDGALPDPDAGPDEMLDAMPGELDAPIDDEDAAAALDASADAGEDAGVDAGEDAGEDAGVDAGFDAGRDAATATDVPRDTGRDVGVDARDTGVRVDTGRDAGAPIDNPDFRRVPERATQFPLAVMAGDAAAT